jgi:8-oxo-dGTP pyrophosphatase MutT (NUDIX family)
MTLFKKIAYSCLLLSSALSYNVFAGVSGLLLVAQHNGSHFTLLVKDHTRAYFELPAGHSETGDKLNDGHTDLETSYETALREAVEETRGYLGRRLLIQGSNSQKRIRYGKFDMFLAKIPMFKISEIIKIRMPQKDNWSPMREIIDYAWVNINQLQDLNTVTDMQGRSIQVHAALPAEIKLAQAQGWFN